MIPGNFQKFSKFSKTEIAVCVAPSDSSRHTSVRKSIQALKYALNF